ncbi:hypothetical protein KSP40_PGU021135 [Platanthera guangdongensis]|uniref:Uncharacterized protein n=1 Tax=Platanthera guangdongensis TaxID=2320717 RepID=A0ABR2M8F2_9ASPA
MALLTGVGVSPSARRPSFPNDQTFFLGSTLARLPAGQEQCKSISLSTDYVPHSLCMNLLDHQFRLHHDQQSRSTGFREFRQGRRFCIGLHQFRSAGFREFSEAGLRAFPVCPTAGATDPCPALQPSTHTAADSPPISRFCASVRFRLLPLVSVRSRSTVSAIF